MRPDQQPLTLTVPEAGALLGLGRDASYAAAARGEIPTLRFGRRVVVPVPKLYELVGLTTPDMSEDEPASSSIASTNPHGGPREQSSSGCGTTPHLRNVS